MLEVNIIFDFRHNALTIQDLIDSRIVSVDEETTVEEVCEVSGHIIVSATVASLILLPTQLLLTEDINCLVIKSSGSDADNPSYVGLFDV